MLKKLAAIAMALPGVGCAYLSDRGMDFADCFRLEASVGAGLQADVMVGEFAHVGLGSSRRWTWGLEYGTLKSEKRVEDHLPLSFVWAVVNRETEAVHSLRIGEELSKSQHKCFLVFPGELHRSLYEKDPVHYLDIDVGAFFAFIGFQVGFSIGEFFDFLLGWFGLDIAGDDGRKRERKRLYRPYPEALEKEREKILGPPEPGQR